MNRSINYYNFNKPDKIAVILAFVILISGCAFLAPDYLKLISADDLNKLMQSEDILLIDVHTPEQQHIKGTDIFIPFNRIADNLDKLPKDKNTAIYLYCEGGPMGNAAARDLYALGYQNLTNLKGGSHAWRQAGFAFE